MNKVILLLLLLASFLYNNDSLAQNPDRNKPLEITADDSLEWHRNELYFRANKNVRASQGQTTLLSDILTAKYREGKDGGMDVYLINAKGSVEIISPQSKAYGDKATYDIDKGYAIMHGNNLRLISEDQNVYARDEFKYWIADSRLEAIGKAKAVRLGDTLEADKIIASFTKDKQGKQRLETLEALGNVVITTPDEVLTGGRAIYQSSTNIAEIHENVKITRGPNIIEGARAQVNLDNNISKIFGNSSITSDSNSETNTKNGRVRGIFYPNSTKD